LDDVNCPSVSGIGFEGVRQSMSLTRREFLVGAAAASVVGSVSEAHAYSHSFSKSAMAYFNGIAADNGYTYRLTNWKKI
jgi:hypothetical protein